MPLPEEDAPVGIVMPDMGDEVPELAGGFDVEWVEFELLHAASRAAPAAVRPMSAKRIRIGMFSFV
jgi:hypothetical protein